MLKAEIIQQYINKGKNVKNKSELSEIFDNLYDGTLTTEYFYNAVTSGFYYSDKKELGKIITAYRIGKPRYDNFNNEYYPSHNFADNKNECGISICSTKWFNSLKSIFFGIHDNALKYKGVYKVTGVIIGFGGDDEPLLYLTEHPEKTRIRTTDGLKKAVKMAERMM